MEECGTTGYTMIDYVSSRNRPFPHVGVPLGSLVDSNSQIVLKFCYFAYPADAAISTVAPRFRLSPPCLQAELCKHPIGLTCFQKKV